MNPEQWLSLKWNGGSTMSDRWLNQSKIIHVPMISFLSYIQVGQEVRMIDYGIFTGVLYLLGILFTIWGVRKYDYV